MNDLELQLKHYDELMLIESFMQSNEALVKNAGFADTIQSYFSNQIDPNDKSKWKTMANLLAPGSIMYTLTKFKHPILGGLLGLAVSVFNIDVASIYTKVYDKIRQLSAGKTPTSSDIDSIVDSVISGEDSSVSAEEALAISKMSLNQSDIDLIKKHSSNYLTVLNDDAKIEILRYKYAAGALSVKLKLLMFIGKIFKHIFFAAFAALGINLAVNVGKKMLDKPNAIDGKTYSKEKREEQRVSKQRSTNTHKSTQKKFPLNSSYSNRTYNTGTSNWIERYSNTSGGILSMMLKFTHEVYGGLSGMNSKIQSARTFQVVKNRIENYNINAVGDNVVFIPKEYKTKKQLVDEFIDDVAKMTPTIPKTPVATPSIPEKELIVS